MERLHNHHNSGILRDTMVGRILKKLIDTLHGRNAVALAVLITLASGVIFLLELPFSEDGNSKVVEESITAVNIVFETTSVVNNSFTPDYDASKKQEPISLNNNPSDLLSMLETKIEPEESTSQFKPADTGDLKESKSNYLEAPVGSVTTPLKPSPVQPKTINFSERGR